MQYDRTGSGATHAFVVYLVTDHAAPAVILYDVVLSLQAIGWVLLSHTAVIHKLGLSEAANREIKKMDDSAILPSVYTPFVPSLRFGSHFSSPYLQLLAGFFS